MIPSRRTLLLLFLIVASTTAESTLRHSRRSLANTSSGNIYDQYDKNSEGRSKFTTAFFGFVAAVGTLGGFLYLIDKEVRCCA